MPETIRSGRSGRILVDLGQEGVEALQVALRDHAGGHELAQGLQVLLLGGPARGLGGADVGRRTAGAAGLVRPAVGGLQVGQQPGVDTAWTTETGSAGAPQ